MMMKIKLGYDAKYKTPITADFSETGHCCVAGDTGSGKSVFVLYLLYNLLKNLDCVELFIGDFKESGDYKGISQHFAEFDGVVTLIDDFYAEFENTPEGSQTIKILLLEEYAGIITWLMLTQKDKKRCDEIKGKISNLLMLGRSRHCYVWCIQQRMTAQLFPPGIGAIDNFQVLIGLGRLTTESRRCLFASEHMFDSDFESSFKPRTGQGLVLIDGQPLQPLQVPQISDKEKLKKVIRNLAANRRYAKRPTDSKSLQRGRRVSGGKAQGREIF